MVKRNNFGCVDVCACVHEEQSYIEMAHDLGLRTSREESLEQPQSAKYVTECFSFEEERSVGSQRPALFLWEAPSINLECSHSRSRVVTK